MNKKNTLPIIAAIDEIPLENISEFLKKEIPEISIVKLGLETFNLGGKVFLDKFEKESDVEYFLDLKLHDIPNTVYNAIKSLEGLSPKFLTIHLSGGKEMINSAIKARDNYLPSTKIIGVTYLTSLSYRNFDDLWGEEKHKLIHKITTMASTTSIDGIVCSANDIPEICPSFLDKIIITPGIRLHKNEKGDQQRVSTPEFALNKGSSYLVVGRPLRNEKTKKEIIGQVENFYLSQ